MLNPHREMKPVQHMVSRTKTRRLSKGSRTFGAIAQDGDRRVRRRSQPMQHAAQLSRLPISLGGHAAEHDLLPVIVADLRDEEPRTTAPDS